VRFSFLISTGSPGWKFCFELDGISICRRFLEYRETLEIKGGVDAFFASLFAMSTNVDRGYI